ncbi:NusG domain II-containing protein [Methylophilaceae bacterium]|nr:NusG domain II-containing protein [Methylophilaceae bacterium]
MIKEILKFFNTIKAGDWFIIILFCALIIVSTKFLWNLPQGEYLEIYKNNKILATYSLNQKITKIINGAKGDTKIIIDNGRVRFVSAPCTKKYCIHQGWINKANQIIICIPNKISISILGNKKNYDSINY